MQNNEEYCNAADPEGYYEDNWKCTKEGCICDWSWVGHAYKIVIEKANCPYHKVMY